MNSQSRNAKIATMTVAILFVTAAAAFAATSVSKVDSSQMSPLMRSIIDTMADASQNMQ